MLVRLHQLIIEENVNIALIRRIEDKPHFFCFCADDHFHSVRFIRLFGNLFLYDNSVVIGSCNLIGRKKERSELIWEDAKNERREKTKRQMPKTIDVDARLQV